MSSRPVRFTLVAVNKKARLGPTLCWLKRAGVAWNWVAAWDYITSTFFLYFQRNEIYCHSFRSRTCRTSRVIILGNKRISFLQSSGKKSLAPTVCRHGSLMERSCLSAKPIGSTFLQMVVNPRVMCPSVKPFVVLGLNRVPVRFKVSAQSQKVNP